MRLACTVPRGYRARVYNVTQGVVDRLIDRGTAVRVEELPYFDRPVHLGR